jgi:hypothetical protein
MQKQNKNPGKDRSGDTGRTSNQGRKLASGGNSNKTRNPEMDDNANSVKAELKIRSGKPGRK